MKHFFVYIIYSSSYNIYYIGQTNDLDDRMIRHNSNRSNFTKGKGHWKLISSIKLNAGSEALKLERKLKNMKNSKKAIEYLNKLVQSIPTNCPSEADYNSHNIAIKRPKLFLQSISTTY